MTIEILCRGCEECDVVHGKVCQALADLNLNASVVSIMAPSGHEPASLCGQPSVLINGHLVTTGSDCTVQQLKRLLNHELSLGH